MAFEYIDVGTEGLLAEKDVVISQDKYERATSQEQSTSSVFGQTNVFLVPCVNNPIVQQDYGLHERLSSISGCIVMNYEFGSVQILSPKAGDQISQHLGAAISWYADA
jgi:hypothetical protein